LLRGEEDVLDRGLLQTGFVQIPLR